MAWSRRQWTRNACFGTIPFVCEASRESLKIMPNSKILYLSLLMAAFGAGYCVRGIDFADAVSLTNPSAAAPKTASPLAANRKSEPLDKISRLAQSASGIRLSEQAVNRSAAVSRTQALPMAAAEAAPRDTHELLGALDAKLAQNPEIEEIGRASCRERVFSAV